METSELQKFYTQRHAICLAQLRSLLQPQQCRKMLAQIWMGWQTAWNAMQMGNISYLIYHVQLAESIDNSALYQATE